MSESSFATKLLGRKAQLLASSRHEDRAGASGEIVSIFQDNGGNLRYTMLLGDGSLVTAYEDELKIIP